MRPKDATDIQFAARLVMDGYMDQATMEQILASQAQLIDRGKPLTIAQICVMKRWLSRGQARLLVNPDKPPADLIEGYRITGHLGTGGMSWVYEARPEGAGAGDDVVALKVLKPNLARKDALRRRFQRESELLIKFEHPNIVKGKEAIESDGLFAFVMECVPGRELLHLIEQGGRFREDAALYVILQAARGLTHMYSHGVVHRDIKPGNILVTADNTAKICDLGLASVGREDGGDDTTVGTVEYISPEQAMGDADLDVRSDIYALGVTLYHMVVGEIPFQGADSHETMAKRFVESLSSPKLSHLSPHMDYFIQKMMATDKDIRYQSPDELIQDVEESIRGKKSLTINPLAEGADRALQIGHSVRQKDDKSGVSASKSKGVRRAPTPRRRRR